MTAAARRTLPSTIPTTGPERVESLERLAAELVEVLGATGAKFVAALIDEAAAEQEKRQ